VPYLQNAADARTNNGFSVSAGSGNALLQATGRYRGRRSVPRLVTKTSADGADIQGCPKTRCEFMACFLCGLCGSALKCFLDSRSKIRRAAPSRIEFKDKQRSFCKMRAAIIPHCKQHRCRGRQSAPRGVTRTSADTANWHSAA